MIREVSTKRLSSPDSQNISIPDKMEYEQAFDLSGRELVYVDWLAAHGYIAGNSPNPFTVPANADGLYTLSVPTGYSKFKVNVFLHADSNTGYRQAAQDRLFISDSVNNQVYINRFNGEGDLLAVFY